MKHSMERHVWATSSTWVLLSSIDLILHIDSFNLQIVDPVSRVLCIVHSTAARCDGAPIIKNGFIVGNKSGVFKDERPVQCYPEFHYQGPDKIKCLHDGQWSYPGNCNGEL